MRDIIEKYAKIPLLLLISGLTYVVIKAMGHGEIQPSVMMATIGGTIVAIAIQFALVNRFAGKDGQQVYLSFNNTDLGLGKTIAAALATRGMAVSTPSWIGFSQSQSRQKIDGADVLLVILSRRHANSKILKSEIEYALAQDKRIIFIHTEDEPISKYQGLASLNLSMEEANKSGLDRIANDIIHPHTAFA